MFFPVGFFVDLFGLGFVQARFPPSCFLNLLKTKVFSAVFPFKIPSLGIYFKFQGVELINVCF